MGKGNLSIQDLKEIGLQNAAFLGRFSAYQGVSERDSSIAFSSAYGENTPASLIAGMEFTKTSNAMNSAKEVSADQVKENVAKLRAAISDFGHKWEVNNAIANDLRESADLSKPGLSEFAEALKATRSEEPVNEIIAGLEANRKTQQGINAVESISNTLEHVESKSIDRSHEMGI